MSTPEDGHPDTADITLVNATQCSRGTGPGYAFGVPWDEARALVDAGLAVYGMSFPWNMFRGPQPVTPP